MFKNNIRIQHSPGQGPIISSCESTSTSKSEYVKFDFLFLDIFKIYVTVMIDGQFEIRHFGLVKLVILLSLLLDHVMDFIFNG